MLKYDSENESYICPYCGGLLEEYIGGDIIIQVYTCENCGKEMDSNGEGIEDWEEFLIEKD